MSFDKGSQCAYAYAMWCYDENAFEPITKNRMITNHSQNEEK